MDGQELSSLQKRIWDVNVDATLQDYIVALAEATRDHPDLSLGVSPRGSLALLKAAQALAAIRGRDYVSPGGYQDARAADTCPPPHPQAGGRTARPDYRRLILESVLEKTPLDLGDVKS